MLEYLKLKTIVSIAIAVLASLLLLGATLYYNIDHPLVFKMTQCEVRDDTYIQRDHIFKTEICRTKENGILVHAYETNVVHTFQKAD